jgi:hypothetical protein
MPAQSQHSLTSRRDNPGHDRVVETELEDRNAFVLSNHNHRDEDLNPTSSSSATASTRAAAPVRPSTTAEPRRTVLLSRDFEADEDLERGSAAVIGITGQEDAGRSESQRRKSR